METTIENPAMDHQTPRVWPKKKRGAMNLIMVALYMMRRHNSKSKKTSSALVYSNAASFWNTLVGSMRPFKFQMTPTKRSVIPPPPPPPMFLLDSPYANDEGFPSGMHSVSSMASMATDSRYMSAVNLYELDRYMSAMNLQQLDQSEDVDENEYEGDRGDELIDTKADEFINQFYTQMKIQKEETINDPDAGLVSWEIDD